MKITCMLVFWDEPAKDLYAWGKSAGQLADNIVAADGPFALYPHDEVESDPVALAALAEGVADGGAELTLLDGREWAGQVAKRSAVAQACAPTDWVFWMDADERIRLCDAESIRSTLNNSATEAFTVDRFTPENPDARWRPDSIQAEREGETFSFNRLFRYYETMEVRHCHWGYVGWRPGGHPIYYWGEVPGTYSANIGRMSQDILLFEHRQTWRSDAYRKKQLDYREATKGQVQENGAES